MMEVPFERDNDGLVRVKNQPLFLAHHFPAPFGSFLLGSHRGPFGSQGGTEPQRKKGAGFALGAILDRLGSSRLPDRTTIPPEAVKSLVFSKNQRVELKNGLRRCRPFFVISGPEQPAGSSRNQFSASPVGGSYCTQPEDR